MLPKATSYGFNEGFKHSMATTRGATKTHINLITNKAIKNAQNIPTAINKKAAAINNNGIVDHRMYL